MASPTRGRFWSSFACSLSAPWLLAGKGVFIVISSGGSTICMQGIEEQLLRLEEVAEMQADWRLQAEAQDEVERLLRTP